MNKKKAFITGISGQDGSFLAELLLEKDYEVYGIIRRNSTPEHQESRIDHLQDRIHTDYCDLLDTGSLNRLLKLIQPDEIYNLAAQSHVRISFDIPQFTLMTNGLGVLNLLEGVKENCKDAKVYQASSSECFGNSVDNDGYQRITTAMHPVSPYGNAKLYAYNICKIYRESYKMFICNGILFNHESPRRASNFVTAKIIKAAVEIKKGLKTSFLELGNLDSYSDWGHSKDYVKAMNLILTYINPLDWVVSSQENHSVRELCNYVFTKLNLNYEDYVKINSKYLRPNELDSLKGDSTPIRQILKWKPTYTFESLLDEMIEFYYEKY